MCGIYIHIPFCKQACHYCDFHFSTNLKKKTELINALCSELILRKHELEHLVVETIYFGGGTPSLLATEELQQILNTIYSNYKICTTPEITLEANPDDLMRNTKQPKLIFEQYKAIGINRLSIGIQSFYNTHLSLLNRAHNAAEATQCVVIAKEFFSNISIDLIYGIPGLSNAQWQDSISTALALNVPHISSYALTIEPRTALEHFIKIGTIKPIDDRLAQEHFQILIEALEQQGYIHYELSNFGKLNYFSKNNTAYWLGKLYMGVGPSAHSYNGKERSWNISNNAKYIQSISLKQLPMEKEILSKTDSYNEYIMTGLRTLWGVSLVKVSTIYGEDYKTYLLKQSEKYLNENLLSLVDGVLKVTPRGKFLSDGIAAHLFKIN